MFGLKKDTMSMSPAPVVTVGDAGIPQMEPIAIPEDCSEFEGKYRELCAELKITAPPLPSGTQVREVKLVLQELGLQMYDYGKAAEFMAKKADQETTARAKAGESYEWAWLAVRRCDVPTEQKVNFGQREKWAHIQKRSFKGGVGPFDLWFLYSKPIPVQVLMTMKRVQDKIRDAQFFIADIIDVAHPDPFLAVSVDDINEMFVIERWDEPSFRG